MARGGSVSRRTAACGRPRPSTSRRGDQYDRADRFHRSLCHAPKYEQQGRERTSHSIATAARRGRTAGTMDVTACSVSAIGIVSTPKAIAAIGPSDPTRHTVLVDSEQRPDATGRKTGGARERDRRPPDGCPQTPRCLRWASRRPWQHTATCTTVGTRVGSSVDDGVGDQCGEQRVDEHGRCAGAADEDATPRLLRSTGPRAPHGCGHWPVASSLWPMAACRPRSAVANTMTRRAGRRTSTTTARPAAPPR